MEAMASEVPDYIPPEISSRHEAAARRAVHRGCGLRRCPSRAAAWRPTIIRLLVATLTLAVVLGLLLVAAILPSPLNLAVAVAAGLTLAWAAHPLACNRVEELQ